MKIDTIKQLQDQVDMFRRSQHSDTDKVRRELTDMQSKIISKDAIIQELHLKCEDLLSYQVVEIPIYARGNGQNKKKRQNKAARSKSQNRGGKQQLQFVRDINDDQEFNEFFFDEEEDHSIRGGMFAPSHEKRVKQEIKEQDGSIPHSSVLPYMNGIFDIDQIIANQIMAAKVAEQALKDLQSEAEMKIGDIHAVLDEAGGLQDHMANMVQEKQEVTARLTTVQAENDQIKIKFAKLLDQFQEYVNENEVRMQEEEFKMRQGQDMVLSELHSTIKELEQLS